MEETVEKVKIPKKGKRKQIEDRDRKTNLKRLKSRGW